MDDATPVTARRSAELLVEHARDDPTRRVALCTSIYSPPRGRLSRQLPYRRAALSFMRWQLHRGLLEPLDAPVPGSAWWRAVNERLLRDGCEAIARSRGLGGAPSSPTIKHWSDFISRPSASRWYRAHNASIVAGYLEHEALAQQETSAERFFMNVALLRVLYAHALVAAPRLSLGRFAPIGPPLGDPRLGMAGAFLSLSHILPTRYPATDAVHEYVNAENNLGRLLDYGVILPRLQSLYEWSAGELEQAALCQLVDGGLPSYAVPFAADVDWTPATSTRLVRALRGITSQRPRSTQVPHEQHPGVDRGSRAGQDERRRQPVEPPP
jgi:hypothetical protein